MAKCLLDDLMEETSQPSGSTCLLSHMPTAKGHPLETILGRHGSVGIFGAEGATVPRLTQ